MINIFVNIMHIIRILDKSFRIIKCFNPIFSLFLIKNWYLSSYGSLAYKYILSISGWLFIKFSNAFVFPDPKPPIINILYGWSRMYGHLRLFFLLFSLVYISKFILYNLYCHTILLYLFPPKSCDTIILFVLSLCYFCCTYSLQKLMTYLFNNIAVLDLSKNLSLVTIFIYRTCVRSIFSLASNPFF